MQTHIVIVNQGRELGRLFAHMLTTYGYPVSVYRHWPQALHAMIRQPPALAFLDKHMPDGSPSVMCKLLHEYCPNTHILMWGLDWLPDEKRHLCGLGAAEFLAGAADAATVAARVHHALHGFEHRKIA